MLRSVDRVIVRVSSLAAAIAYYRDILGLTLVRHETHVASFRLNNSATELVLHDDPDLPAEATYYLVDDVRELFRRRAELKLTFAGPPAPSVHGYRAEAKDPFGNVLRLLDRTTAASGGSAVEDVRPVGGLFSGVEPHFTVKREALVQAYEKLGRTADDLPYTPHFETLYLDYAAAFGEIKPSRQEVWRHLLNLRKGGKLPRLGEARSIPPEISPEERAQLRSLLGKEIGKRDRLPYTPRFDEIVNAFNEGQARPLSPHLVWRLVATIAK